MKNSNKKTSNPNLKNQKNNKTDKDTTQKQPGGREKDTKKPIQEDPSNQNTG